LTVRLHPHARSRLVERGATEAEAIATVENGTTFAVKFGRTGFRRTFPFNDLWRGKRYSMKKIEAIAVRDGEDWLIITVIVKFF